MDGEGGDVSAAPRATAIVEVLNDLLQLDHDAIAAYQIAMEKLAERRWAERILDFRRDHERHVRELNRVIVELGGTPTNEPHVSGPLWEALQGLGALGGDRGVLLCFRANELKARARYRKCVAGSAAWPDEVRRVIDQNALDEERHYRWVNDVLQDSDTLSGGDSGGNAAARLREGLARLGQAAGEARARAADGLEIAAQRLDRLAEEQGGAGETPAGAAAVAHRLAGGLGATADLLRSGGGDTDIRGAIEQEARTRPLRAVLVTFALGFIVGRIIR